MPEQEQIMDESRQPSEVVGLPMQGSHGLSAFRPALPCDFMPMRLLLQPGTMAIELTAPDMVLGRHTEADLRLPLPDVSRRHCRFVYAGGHWQVIDLQSLNGVWVNDQMVQRSPLYHGDRLRIGELVFLVDLPSETDAVGETRAAEPTLYDLFRSSLARSQPSLPPRRLAG
jgi:pSer/pThr/pTyr-binding forkhead associated (FHA) protein